MNRLVVIMLAGALTGAALWLCGCATTRSTPFSPCRDLRPGMAVVYDVTTSQIPFLSEPHRSTWYMDAKGNCQPPVVEGPVSNSLEGIASQPIGTLLSSPLVGGAILK